jgi:lipopolysaccharide biosynthesis regulator YciM
MNPIALLTQRFGSKSARHYECQRCSTRYEIQYHVCPTCESFSVEPRRQLWTDRENDAERTG